LHNYIPHSSQIDPNNPSLEVISSKKMLYVIGSRAKTNLHFISETGRLKNGNEMSINTQLNNVNFKYDCI